MFVLCMSGDIPSSSSSEIVELAEQDARCPKTLVRFVHVVQVGAQTEDAIIISMQGFGILSATRGRPVPVTGTSNKSLWEGFGVGVQY
jgi:hypothetical protein